MARTLTKWIAFGAAVLSCFYLVYFFNFIPGNPSQDIPTLNRYGWIHSTGDRITQQFLEECGKKSSSVSLEIGAGNGAASLDALKKGAFVWVNDLSQIHLQDFTHRVSLEHSHNYKIVIGDFVDNIVLPHAYFDIVLAARVLHFFDPAKLERAIVKIHDTLKPGGKIFVLAATPYLKEWESFVSEYEQRKGKGEKYPGYIENFSHYNSHFKSLVPEKMHFLDPEVLRREFEKVGFTVLFSDFVEQEKGSIEDRALVGLIAQKY